MDKSIWDLKKGDTLLTSDGVLCQVDSDTKDGKGLVVVYLEGSLKGQSDFLFDEEIDVLITSTDREK